MQTLKTTISSRKCRLPGRFLAIALPALAVLILAAAWGITRPAVIAMLLESRGLEEVRVDGLTFGKESVRLDRVSFLGGDVLGIRAKLAWTPLPRLIAVEVEKLELRLQHNSSGVMLGMRHLTSGEKSSTPWQEALSDAMHSLPPRFSVLSVAVHLDSASHKLRLEGEASLTHNDGSASLIWNGALASDIFGGKLLLSAKYGRDSQGKPLYTLDLASSGGEGDISRFFPSIKNGQGFAELERTVTNLRISGDGTQWKAGLELFGRGKLAIPGYGSFPKTHFRLVTAGEGDAKAFSGRVEDLFLGMEGDASVVLVPDLPILMKDAKWHAVTTRDKKKPRWSLTDQDGKIAVSWDGALNPLAIQGKWMEGANNPTTPANITLTPTSMKAKVLVSPNQPEGEKIDWQDGSELAVEAAISQLHLQTVLGYWMKDAISADGTVSGKLPIRLSKTGLEVMKGNIKADSAGAVRYRASTPVTEGGMAIAYQALENLQFSVLDAAINSDEANKLTAMIRLEGKNPALYDGVPIQLNVNAHVDATNLWKAGSEAWRLEQAVSKGFGNR